MSSSKSGGTLKRLLSWPSSARAAARELQKANELLHRRQTEHEAEIRKRRRAEEELRAYAQEMALLNKIIVSGAATDNLLDLLQGTVEHLAKFLCLDSAGAYLLRGSGRVAQLQHSLGERVAQSKELPVDEPPFSTVFIGGRTLHSEDHPELLTDSAKSCGFQSAVLVPISWGSQVSGAFLFAGKQQQCLTPSNSKILRTAGRQLGAFVAKMEAEEEREQLILELEGKNTELERFAYTVSHDLKSPLITIRGFLVMIEKDAAQGDLERLKRDIQMIEGATETMGRLLEDLLQLSRVGQVESTTEDIALSELARAVVGLLSGRIAGHGVEVTVGDDLPVVHGVRNRLTQLLMNLIDNAVKFLADHPQGKVEIGARRDGDETVCYVRDNGPGIDARDATRIFKAFAQVDPGREGTGIGLSIVRRVVESHGGQVWIESEGRDKGTTFCFTLPLASG